MALFSCEYKIKKVKKRFNEILIFVTGMGLLWMAHKTPGTAGWDLALRSQKLWQSLADNLQNKGIDPSQALGWKKAGSLVIGSTEAELEELKRQVELLTAAGLRAEYLSAEDLALREPGLRVGWESGAVFLSDDCQLDARHTVAFLEQVIVVILNFCLILMRATGCLHCKADTQNSTMIQQCL